MSSQDFKEIIISSLEVLRKDEINNREVFKARAYQTVINQLKVFENPVNSITDLKDFKGIGVKIKKKIEEIFETGKLKKAEAILNNEDNISINLFENVYGIGPVKARELVEKHGIKTISELRKAVAEDKSILNDNQLIGLKYYEDLIERIPRSEMDEHAKLIVNKISEVSENKLISCIVGSYRRQAQSSGDIDVIVTAKDQDMKFSDMEQLFSKCIDVFIKEKYIIEILASGHKKCLAISSLPGENKTARRLDLLLTLPEEYFYSLLYFTGSQSLNIKMRTKALELGWTLNEYALTSIKKNKIKNVKPPKMQSEKDIFEFLEMEYLEPQQRN